MTPFDRKDAGPRPGADVEVSQADLSWEAIGDFDPVGCDLVEQLE